MTEKGEKASKEIFLLRRMIQTEEKIHRRMVFQSWGMVVEFYFHLVRRPSHHQWYQSPEIK